MQILATESFAPATMPSADFSHTVRAGCPTLSQNSVARDFSKGTWEISRGKAHVFRYVNAEYTDIAYDG